MNTGKKNLTNLGSIWIENIKNLVQIVAIIAAACWSYSTFVNPEKFRPNDYKPHLNIETKLESLRVLPDRTVATLGIHVVNKSKRFLRIVASHYELFGLNYFPSAKNINLRRIVDDLNKNRTTLIRRDLFTRVKTPRISIGRIIPEQWRFAPEESYSYQIVVAIPCKVSAFQMNLSFRYDHADAEVFSVQWWTMTDKEKNEIFWYNTKIKTDGQYVTYDPEDTPEHKEIGKKHGHQFMISTTEIDIPRELPIGKCSMTSSSQYGGN